MLDDEIVRMRVARASDRVHDGCATPDLVEAIEWTPSVPCRILTPPPRRGALQHVDRRR